MKMAVHPDQWARQRLVRDGCFGLFATNDAFNSDVLHQSDDRATRNAKAFTPHLAPNLAHAVDAEVFLKDTFNLGLKFCVSLGTIRKAQWVYPVGQIVIERCWGNRQHAADWLDPMVSAMIFNELDHRLNGRSRSAWAK